MASKQKIERGDIVRHIPSGENWVVLRVEPTLTDTYIHAAGWPKSAGKESDCELTKKGGGLHIISEIKKYEQRKLATD